MKKILFIIVFIVSTLYTKAQKDSVRLDLTLEQAIQIANTQSIYSFRQKNMYLSSYWDYRSFKAERLPSLSLSSNPINYQHTIESRYDSETKEDVFEPTERLTSDASLEISQNIIATGAEVTAESSLQRIQNIESGNLSYYSTPITIGISQPLSGYNEFKWTAKIEPLKFEQAKREYLQSLQEVAIETTESFFDLVSSEIDLTIAETNLSNADTLYRIGKGRFEIGTVTQDELLDLELTLLNAQMSVTKAQVSLQQARISLNSFLGFDDNIVINCVVPHEVPSFKIKVDEAMDKAYTNNPEMLDYEQQMLEAEQSLAETRGENGIVASISGNMGYNKNSNSLEEVYQSPYGNEQNLSVSLSMPIIDWGLRKGKIQMAKSNREVVEATVKQGKIDFEQDIFISVMEFNMQEQQVKIAAKADTIAQLGYEVTKQRFLIDKVTVIKLNSARNSLDDAKRAYIESLQSYWNSYYSIRKKTLFDFEKKESLIHELDDLLDN